MNILFVCNPQEEEEEILTNCGFANLSLYDMCIKKESVMYILEKHFLCTPNSYILHTNTQTYMYTIVWVESRKIFIKKNQSHGQWFAREGSHEGGWNQVWLIV